MTNDLDPPATFGLNRLAPILSSNLFPDWSKSPAGKAWLAKNQKKKNRRRDAWRKRKRLEAKKAKSGNDARERGATNDDEKH